MTTPLVAVAVWLLWGGTFVAVKLGLQVSPASWFGTLRVASAGLVLLPLMALLPARDRHHLMDPKVIRYGALLGLGNVAGLIGFVNFAMVEAGAGLSAVVVYTQPFLVAVAARFLFREQLTRRQVVGLLCGWLGVVAVVSNELLRGSLAWPSLLLLLAASCSWGLGTLVFKAVPHDVPLWPMLMWQNVIGIIPLAAISAFQPPTIDWGWQLLLTLAFAGVGAGVAGFGLQFVLLRRGAASVVGSWIFAVPVVSSLLGVVILGEPASLTLLIGVAAVAVGIYLVNSTERRVARVPSAAVP